MAVGLDVDGAADAGVRVGHGGCRVTVALRERGGVKD